MSLQPLPYKTPQTTFAQGPIFNETRGAHATDMVALETCSRSFHRPFHRPFHIPALGICTLPVVEKANFGEKKKQGVTVRVLYAGMRSAAAAATTTTTTTTTTTVRLRFTSGRVLCCDVSARGGVRVSALDVCL